MTDSSSLETFLSSLCVRTDDHHCSVDQAPLEPAENMIAPLTHYGFILTEGPDSTTFLQGQTTCNLKEITAEQSRPGALCTAKGRMVSSFLLAAVGEQRYLLRTRADLVESTKAALGKYIVFSKATQADYSCTYLAVGLRGPRAAANIEAAFGSIPTTQYQQVSADTGIAIRLDGQADLYECWIPADRLSTVWPILSTGLELQGSKSWELLTVRQGLGEVCAATADEFIPQMLNYQATGAISFNKGCYTGQEVVARMQYKGTMKRRLFHIRIEGAESTPNAPLFRPGSEQSIGNIVNAVELPDGATEALAVITISDAEQGTVLAGTNLSTVQVLSLPYAITN